MPRHRVASVDLRGHGESSTDWGRAYSRTDTARDLIAVIGELGGPAVIVGQSFWGGARDVVAATNPDLVDAIRRDRPVYPPPEVQRGGAVNVTPITAVVRSCWGNSPSPDACQDLVWVGRHGLPRAQAGRLGHLVGCAAGSTA